jgi:hypothetical protein
VQQLPYKFGLAGLGGPASVGCRINGVIPGGVSFLQRYLTVEDIAK